MKKLLFALLLVIVSTGVNAQKVVHNFNFDRVCPPDREKTVDGVGSLIVYDNYLLVISGNVGGKEYKFSFKPECSSLNKQANLIFYSKYGDSTTRSSNPLIILGGSYAIYMDKRNPNSKVVLALTTTDAKAHVNDKEMNSFIEEYKTDTGVFSR